MSKLRIVLSSPVDRDSVVAELWSGNDQLAELRRDGTGLRLQLYNSSSLACRDLAFDEFVDALRRLRQALD